MSELKFSPKVIQSIAYVNVIKELKSRNTEFHTYKPKQEKSCKVILKYIYPSSNVDNIRKEIEDHGYTITNIWNIKKQDTSKTFPIFYIELKAENNKRHLQN